MATWQFWKSIRSLRWNFYYAGHLLGWKANGITPDKYDIPGGIIALVGLGIIMYAPRG